MARHNTSPESATHTRLDERFAVALHVIERILVYAVALFLIAFAVLALINTVKVAWDPIVHTHDYGVAITQGVDTVFLTIILLELLNTVLSRGPISRQLQEFLVIGITSSVRHSLTTTANTASAREIGIDLGLNAIGVLILVVALWLVRQQVGVSAEERMDSDVTAPGKAASQ